MAGIGALAYNFVFKRTSTFLVAAVGTAFFFERGVDAVTNAIFDGNNRGKQWKDLNIKDQ
jgi:hypothetical protein